MTKVVLEVIACSLADAIEAEKGGANRLEVVRELDLGGLTPSLELVRATKNAVDLPLRVMLRESVGYETRDEDEVERLCVAAEEFAILGVDGVVIGFLKGDQIDSDLTERVLGHAPGLRATFHHAFEDARDQLQAVLNIKKLSQVDRILSNGGPGALRDRIERLGAYANTASPELTIIAGGGIDRGAISELMRSTVIREFHVGRAARSDFRVDGDVKAALVRDLVNTMQEP